MQIVSNITFEANSLRMNPHEPMKALRLEHMRGGISEIKEASRLLERVERLPDFQFYCYK